MSLRNIVQSITKSTGQGSSRPPFEGIYAYALAALIGYGIADYSVLTIRPQMLSKSAPSSGNRIRSSFKRLQAKNYDGVFKRNIFDSLGEDPKKLSADESKENEALEEQEAVLSKLPLKLEGTIVHFDPKKSVATIVAKNSNESKPYSVGDPIDNLVEKITKIQRRKVVFINKNSGRLEFIEIPLDEKLTLSFKAPKKGDDKNSDVVKRGEFDFQVNRADVNKHLKNISDLLGQARMVPNIPPNSGGQVQGFKFTGIQPGSIYEKLGFKVTDVIRSVNGEDVNSPTKAMELYNALKGQSYIEIGVNRNGRDENFTYSITE